jgi:hypothetical protein
LDLRSYVVTAPFYENGHGTVDRTPVGWTEGKKLKNEGRCKSLVGNEGERRG